MAVEIFKIKEDDTRPALRATLLDADGNAVDLTGVTGVDFVMGPRGTPDAPTVNAPAVIVTAASGIVEYQWVAADTAAAGDFEGEFKVDLDGTNTQTYPTDGFIEVQILEDKA